MNLLEAMENRKSIGQFKPHPLSRVMFQEISRAALRAPSAINTQPWKCWIVGGEQGIQPLNRQPSFFIMRCKKKVDKKIIWNYY